MSHRHQIPLRWSDLDSLNHVNNVVYVEFAAEALASLPGWDASAPITRTVVQFIRPVLLGRVPVVVTSQIVESVAHQEIRIGEGDTVFATVETSTAAPEPVAKVSAPTRYDYALRRRDSLTGEMSTTRLFELFQEARIGGIDQITQEMRSGRFVVAMTEVTQMEPIFWRAEPLETRTWVSHMGTSSYSVASQVIADSRVLAHSTSVLVGFDLATQQSRKLQDVERAQIARGLLD